MSISFPSSANFILETEDKNAYMQKYSSLPPMFVSKLTVKHVDKDMLRVFCSSDGFGKGRDRCLINVVDYVRPDNSSSNSTAKNTAICRSRMPSTTPSPGVYFITHPTQSFLTTPFPFLFSTPPTSDKQPNTVVLLICVIALPIIGAVAIPTLFLWGCYRWKNRKALQRQNEDMTATSNTPQLTPATVPRTDHNDLRSTHVNPPVHQSNNTPTTQSPEHTASIQSPAPKDSPPPYSSLLEPPPYTILPAESYNRDYVPSHQEQNEPPPYTTRYTETYNSKSPSAQLQAPNEPPPPYTVCIPAETPQMVFVG